MKVLLVKPPIRACRVKIGRHMPVGLAYLASSLRQEGHDVELIDFLAQSSGNRIIPEHSLSGADRHKLAAHPRWKYLVHWGADWESVRHQLSEFRPDLVGISCMFTPYYEPAYEIARMVKEIRPGVPVVLGGSHPTSLPLHALNETAIDVVLLGESEYSLPRLASSIAEGRPISDHSGIAYRCRDDLCGGDCGSEGPRVHMTPPRGFEPELDRFPRPAADLLNLDSYGKVATLITSRGCPFSCSFCTVHATVGKEFRARDPHCVVDEILWYRDEFGVREFSIEDDNFTFSLERVVELCDLIVGAGLDIDIHLPNGITALGLSDHLIETMAAAGVKSLFVGLETTDSRDLRRIRKGFTSLERVSRGSENFKDLGISAGASLITGLLGQDLTSVARDCFRLARAGVPYSANPFYPIPGSADYRQCTEKGLVEFNPEYAALEGYNFAVGSDLLDPAELYWAWVTAHAVSQWPAQICDGLGKLDAAGALDELCGKTSTLPRRRRGYEYLAAPVKRDGLVLTVAEWGCFCHSQQVRELDTGGGPSDFCQVTGDVIASALSLLSGDSFSARQMTSRVQDGVSACTFSIDPGASDESSHVYRTFREVFGTTLSAS